LEGTELALISLYHALDTANFDVTQLGDSDQSAHMSADPTVTLPALIEAVDMDVRRDRYAASLAYVLGVRFFNDTGTLEPELSALGGKIVSRFNDSDPFEGELALRSAVFLLSEDKAITQEVADFLTTAFEGKVEFSFDASSNEWKMQGEATEAALMLCELASMGMNCRSRKGRFKLGNTEVPVLVTECEVCTQAPYDRVMVGVDPRNWPVYNPGFFQSVNVVSGTPAATGSWRGVIQESVGALLTGTPIVTNLRVSYLEEKGVAVTAYDLAGDSANLPADDGSVKVDFGFFSVTDEGVHRRIRLLKVLRIENVPMPAWVHPLWAQQLAAIGWWF
jgi:hypothetical protein